MALSEATELYLSELAVTGRSPGTVDLQTYLLRKLATAVGKGHPVTAVNHDCISIYLANFLKAGRKQSYVALNAKVIRRFLGWAAETGIIKENPLRGMRVAAGTWRPVPPFTHDECRRLIVAAKNPMQTALVYLLLDTGLRATELTSLCVADVDLIKGEIRVTAGKGGKVRVVALNPIPRKAILAYLSERVTSNGLLWPEGYDRKKLGGMLLTLGHRAGVEHCHPHRFRHTFASYFLKASGGDALALKALLGHSSLTMVTRYVGVLEGERAVEVHRAHSLV